MSILATNLPKTYRRWETGQQRSMIDNVKQRLLLKKILRKAAAKSSTSDRALINPWKYLSFQKAYKKSVVIEN